MINRNGDNEREKIDITNMSNKDVTLIILRGLVHKGEINKAEDILFEELEKDSSIDMYTIGVEFYNMLLEKSEKELGDANFSREEIEQGLKDIKRYRGLV